jgi:hypothetical protein
MSNLTGDELTLPQFHNSPSITLSLSNVREGERRLIEAKMVNAATYADLEYVFGEGYREAKKNLSVLGFELTKADKALREAKSIAILDHYNDFLKEKGLKDNATVRDAFLETRTDYVAAQDRIDMLKAMISLMEGKVKVFENTCRYMKVEMNLLIRGGVIDNNKYAR